VGAFVEDPHKLRPGGIVTIGAAVYDEAPVFVTRFLVEVLHLEVIVENFAVIPGPGKHTATAKSCRTSSEKIGTQVQQGFRGSASVVGCW